MLFNRKHKKSVDGLGLEDTEDLFDEQVIDVQEKKTSLFGRRPKKKTSTPPGRGASKASRVEIIGNPNSPSKALAFGVTWRSIVSVNNGRAAAIKLAKAEKANVMLFRGAQVGFTHIPEEQQKGVQIYPAAMAAARMHSGSCLFVLRIDAGEYWIASTRNGSPTALDRYIKNAVDSDAVEIATTALEQSGGELTTCFTNVPHHSFANVQTLQPQDLYEVLLSDDDRLKALPKKESSIPKPVLAIIGVAAVGLAAQHGFKYWKAREMEAINALNVAQEEPPEVAWARALADWESKSSGPSARGLDDVRKSLNSLPAVMYGWVLEQARCSVNDMPDQAGQLQRAWQCSANYARTPAGALNREMHKYIPHGYRHEFSPLNSLMLRWHVVTPAQKFTTSELPSVASHIIETTSKLQRLEPAFSQAPNIVFTAVDIPPPHRQDGSLVPPIPAVQGFKMAPLTLAGPLRTIDAVLASDVSAVWKSISLDYRAQQARPGLTSSALMATITGEIYAKQ